jgi:hypothetical protein
MPQTLAAVAITLLAVLPGALYTWAFEQQARRWGANATDRVQRFVGASSVFLVVELPAVYQCYRAFVVSGDIEAGRPLPPLAWALPACLVVGPIVLGRTTGRAAYRRRPWVRLLAGPAPAPRAWDDLFAQADLSGWVILKLNNDEWLAGYWGSSDATGLKSYAAGYPEPQDLLLAETAEIDPDGNLLLGADGQPQTTGVATLVRWDEVIYALFTRD